METIKKSYNPFKMWGSWVGAIMGGWLLNLTLANPGLRLVAIVNRSAELGMHIGSKIDAKTIVTILVVVSLNIIIGFFTGWTIHSIVRKLKN